MNYYELFDVARTASADEIKRAFRREIAKYHPDKVQHLGREFQEIAVTKAAELTQAYKTLSDAAARADYDELLDQGTEEPAHASAAPPKPRSQTEPEAARPAQRQGQPPDSRPSTGASGMFAEERAGAMDLVRRATLARFRKALETEFGRCDEVRVAGFEVTCAPQKKFIFSRVPPQILARFLPQVDAAAITETWSLAAKGRKDRQRDVCIFVLAPVLAPPGELAVAIAEQRRKPMPGGGKLVMVPVNTRTWNAHIPTDAPPAVKSLITRLKSA